LTINWQQARQGDALVNNSAPSSEMPHRAA
jgi:hypothetical protein